jgi:hypothetical protein
MKSYLDSNKKEFSSFVAVSSSEASQYAELASIIKNSGEGKWAAFKSR